MTKQKPKTPSPKPSSLRDKLGALLVRHADVACSLNGEMKVGEIIGMTHSAVVVSLHECGNIVHINASKVIMLPDNCLHSNKEDTLWKLCYTERNIP